jgi:hypothetical protein
LGIEKLLKSESASGGLREPRTPRRPMYRRGVHCIIYKIFNFWPRKYMMKPEEKAALLFSKAALAK